MEVLPDQTEPGVSTTGVPVHEVRRAEFLLSTDPRRLDMGVIHAFLSKEAYWSKGIDRELLRKSIAGSVAFGVYDAKGAQVGFARVVTDGVSFAYLRDVFVLPKVRGLGLGQFIAREALAHPGLRTVQRWMLATEDAHGVYANVGFHALSNPSWYMTLHRESGV